MRHVFGVSLSGWNVSKSITARGCSSGRCRCMMHGVGRLRTHRPFQMVPWSSTPVSGTTGPTVSYDKWHALCATPNHTSTPIPSHRPHGDERLRTADRRRMVEGVKGERCFVTGRNRAALPVEYCPERGVRPHCTQHSTTLELLSTSTAQP